MYSPDLEKVACANGFEDVLFTERTAHAETLVECLRFAAAQGAILQSAREAWAFRLGKRGLLGSNLEQHTRTIVVSTIVDGVYCFCITDSEDPNTNPILAAALAQPSRAAWLLRKADPAVAVTIEKCRAKNRVYRMGTVALPLHGLGAGAYATSPITNAVLGPDLAPAVADYLRQQGNQLGGFYIGNAGDPASAGVTEEIVRVGSIVVGGVNYASQDSLILSNDPSASGFGRGVIRRR